MAGSGVPQHYVYLIWKVPDGTLNVDALNEYLIQSSSNAGVIIYLTGTEVDTKAIDDVLAPDIDHSYRVVEVDFTSTTSMVQGPWNADPRYGNRQTSQLHLPRSRFVNSETKSSSQAIFEEAAVFVDAEEADVNQSELERWVEDWESSNGIDAKVYTLIRPYDQLTAAEINRLIGDRKVSILAIQIGAITRPIPDFGNRKIYLTHLYYIDGSYVEIPSTVSAAVSAALSPKGALLLPELPESIKGKHLPAWDLQVEAKARIPVWIAIDAETYDLDLDKFTAFRYALLLRSNYDPKVNVYGILRGLDTKMVDNRFISEFGSPELNMPVILFEFTSEVKGYDFDTDWKLIPSLFRDRPVLVIGVSKSFLITPEPPLPRIPKFLDGKLVPAWTEQEQLISQGRDSRLSTFVFVNGEDMDIDDSLNTFIEDLMEHSELYLRYIFFRPTTVLTPKLVEAKILSVVAEFRPNAPVILVDFSDTLNDQDLQATWQMMPALFGGHPVLHLQVSNQFLRILPPIPKALRTRRSKFKLQIIVDAEPGTAKKSEIDDLLVDLISRSGFSLGTLIYSPISSVDIKALDAKGGPRSPVAVVTFSNSVHSTKFKAHWVTRTTPSPLPSLGRHPVLHIQLSVDTFLPTATFLVPALPTESKLEVKERLVPISNCNNRGEEGTEDAYLDTTFFYDLKLAEFKSTLVQVWPQPEDWKDSAYAIASGRKPNCYGAFQLWNFLLPKFLTLLHSEGVDRKYLQRFVDQKFPETIIFPDTMSDPSRFRITDEFWYYVTCKADMYDFTVRMSIIASYSAKELLELPFFKELMNSLPTTLASVPTEYKQKSGFDSVMKEITIFSKAGLMYGTGKLLSLKAVMAEYLFMACHSATTIPQMESLLIEFKSTLVQHDLTELYAIYTTYPESRENLALDFPGEKWEWQMRIIELMTTAFQG